MHGGIAHDLNSPLSAIQLDIATLEKYMKSDKVTAESQVKDKLLEILTNINNSMNRMGKTIMGIRNQIRATGDSEKEEISFVEILEGIEILFGSIFRKNNCQLEYNINPDYKLYGEKNKLDRVIGNLIKNSLDAYSENNIKGKINVEVEKKQDKYILSITDKAGGVSKEIQDTLFKKIKTTKGENGTGFGLYYSNTIIESSFNGKMSFKTIDGEGTTFYIELPIKYNFKEEN